MVKLLDDGSFMIPGEERAHDSLDALVAFYQQRPLRPYGDLLIQSCPQVRVGTPRAKPSKPCWSRMPPLPLESQSFLQSPFPWGPRHSWSLFPGSPGCFFFFFLQGFMYQV